MHMVNIAYNTLVVTDTVAVTLTMPVDASEIQQAIITVEADRTSTDLTKAVRFIADQTGVVPDASNGVPLGDLDVREISDINDIINFKCIGIEPGKVHILHIEYFGYLN